MSASQNATTPAGLPPRTPPSNDAPHAHAAYVEDAAVRPRLDSNGTSARSRTLSGMSTTSSQAEAEITPFRPIKLAPTMRRKSSANEDDEVPAVDPMATIGTAGT